MNSLKKNNQSSEKNKRPIDSNPSVTCTSRAVTQDETLSFKHKRGRGGEGPSEHPSHHRNFKLNVLHPSRWCNLAPASHRGVSLLHLPPSSDIRIQSPKWLQQSHLLQSTTFTLKHHHVRIWHKTKRGQEGGGGGRDRGAKCVPRTRFSSNRRKLRVTQAGVTDGI